MSEIYMEGRFKMPVIDTDDLGYDGDEVKKFDWEEFAKDEFWNSCEDMGELEDKYDITFQRVQPQLTIPKSVADMLYEELNPLERESMLEAFVLGINYLVLSDELMKFVLTGNNYHVISAYLAGKALGVELVKVVEG
ncbi:hypothetical protein QUD55_08530 [Lactococcus lactis]|uniref:hypothetical protein n=1 Tax=Lactococcus lactis TaxID=1358 RepID=UPI0025A075FA|nr:hypothetical protein [Lactococcus lactis]MDM7537517.1 hypothetical protein [Lactococcus lactis]